MLKIEIDMRRCHWYHYAFYHTLYDKDLLYPYIFGIMIYDCLLTVKKLPVSSASNRTSSIRIHHQFVFFFV